MVRFFSSVWPKRADDGHSYAERINRLPKYVASRTLSGPLDWNARLIDGDLADTVAELKRSSVGNWVSYGCGELAHSLAHAGPIDEIRFWLHPSGRRARTRSARAVCEPERTRPYTAARWRH